MAAKAARKRYFLFSKAFQRFFFISAESGCVEACRGLRDGGGGGKKAGKISAGGSNEVETPKKHEVIRRKNVGAASVANNNDNRFKL